MVMPGEQMGFTKSQIASAIMRSCQRHGIPCYATYDEIMSNSMSELKVMYYNITGSDFGFCD